MNKLALVALLALEFAVCGCGTSGSPPTFTNTQATGNWEAQLTGGTDQASLLNFVTTFTVTDQGPLSITGFGFFNAGTCFPIGSGAVGCNAAQGTFILCQNKASCAPSTAAAALIEKSK